MADWSAAALSSSIVGGAVAAEFVAVPSIHREQKRNETNEPTRIVSTTRLRNFSPIIINHMLRKKTFYYLLFTYCL
jgi:hypothetical protein